MFLPLRPKGEEKESLIAVVEFDTSLNELPVEGLSVGSNAIATSISSYPLTYRA